MKPSSRGPLRPGEETAPPLPAVGTSVDVTIAGRTEQLCVHQLENGTITIGRPETAREGTRAMFSYTVAGGRYRYMAACTNVGVRTAKFLLPEHITTVESPGTVRHNYRFPLGKALRWRFAPDGIGIGAFAPGNAVDISCGGAALILPFSPGKGSRLEIELVLDGETLALIGTVVRDAPVDAGPDSIGLHFDTIRPFQANAILDFVRTAQLAHQ